MTHVLGTKRRRNVRWTPSPQSVERIFDALAGFAAGSQTLPSNQELIQLLGIGPNTLHCCYRQLVADQRIGIEWNQGARRRKITILVGPQAGKAIETVRRKKAAPAAAKSAPAPPPPAPTPEPRPCCQWCEKPFTRTKKRESASYCGKTCADAARNYGPLVTKRQVEARRAHAKNQPRGCPDLASFLAAGGSIYVEPPRHYGA